MTSRIPVVLVTGGNTGLGLATIRALYEEPQAHHVVMGCRTLATGEAAVAELRRSAGARAHRDSTLSATPVDVTSDASIAALARQLAAAHGRVDVVVHNAGANLDREMQAGRLSAREGWRRAWDVNVVGAQVLTATLAPLMVRNGQRSTSGAAEGEEQEEASLTTQRRLLFITSGTSALADTERMDRQYATINASPPPGWPKPPTLNPTEAYRSSKAGLNMMMRQWARIFANDGIKVFAVSPGFLATGLAGIGEETLTKIGALDPAVGGQFVKDVIIGKRDQDAGKAINVDGIQPW